MISKLPFWVVCFGYHGKQLLNLNIQAITTATSINLDKATASTYLDQIMFGDTILWLFLKYYHQSKNQLLPLVESLQDKQNQI